MRLPFWTRALLCTVAIAGCTGHSPMVPWSDDTFDYGFYPLTKVGAAFPACPPRSDRSWRCNAWVRTDLKPVFTRRDAIPSGVGYTPADIQSAYGLDPAKGSGQTVVIIDAYGYKSAAKDLATYRAAAGLTPCSTSTGCLRVLNQDGKRAPLPAQPPAAESSWLFEQSLDLDAVSAACPQCKIVMIQAKDNRTLGVAISTALRFGTIISMSFGGSEVGASANPGLPASGYALVASSGDFGGGLLAGGGPQVPCTWSAVICVGGTKLTRSGSTWHSVVWNDEKLDECQGPCGATGSGCSTIVPKPSWQHDRGCKMRSEVDVSADASVTTPLAVYNSIALPAPHWAGIGGTSLASPLVAGMIALAGNSNSRHGAMEIWNTHKSLTNVTTGTDVYKPVTGPCASSVHYICIAGVGYNGPTGWGSPEGVDDL